MANVPLFLFFSILILLEGVILLKLNKIFTVLVGNLYVYCGTLYEMSRQFIRFRGTPLP